MAGTKAAVYLIAFRNSSRFRNDPFRAAARPTEMPFPAGAGTECEVSATYLQSSRERGAYRLTLIWIALRYLTGWPESVAG